jgi:hypothetical protein
VEASRRRKSTRKTKIKKIRRARKRKKAKTRIATEIRQQKKVVV